MFIHACFFSSILTISNLIWFKHFLLYLAKLLLLASAHPPWQFVMIILPEWLNSIALAFYIVYIKFLSASISKLANWNILKTPNLSVCCGLRWIIFIQQIKDFTIYLSVNVDNKEVELSSHHHLLKEKYL